jgi:hypothetical protein
MKPARKLPIGMTAPGTGEAAHITHEQAIPIPDKRSAAASPEVKQFPTI